MGIVVREKDLEEIEEKLTSMNTDLNKINYLESALKEQGFSFEIKRFIFEKLSEYYGGRKMFERAAVAMSNKASLEISSKDRVNSYLNAAELFSRTGKIDDAEEMFIRAGRDVSSIEKMKIKLARKNIYMVFAKELEEKGKKVNAAKFYERLIKMNLEEFEKKEIKEKLLSTYNSLGLFREAKLIERL
tara:strand:- start:8480 stop:9043 length:564 start_codon:yes stop_codon:yes gene_type:complete